VDQPSSAACLFCFVWTAIPFNDLEHPGFSDKSMGDAINAKSE
jgi:hypothetical protein